MSPVAVLGVAERSVYRSFRDVELYDRSRDLRTYQGPYPVVAHPPCAQWSRMREFARFDLEEKLLGPLCIDLVRRYGGVVEHPLGSSLFAGLPGDVGHVFPIDQAWFGFPSRKRTLLYIVGCPARALPAFPLLLGEAEGRVELMPQERRSETPLYLAAWLLEVARRCRAAAH